MQRPTRIQSLQKLPLLPGLQFRCLTLWILATLVPFQFLCQAIVFPCQGLLACFPSPILSMMSTALAQSLRLLLYFLKKNPFFIAQLRSDILSLSFLCTPCSFKHLSQLYLNNDVHVSLFNASLPS